MKRRRVYIFVMCVLIAAVLAWFFLSLKKPHDGRSEKKPAESVEPSREDSSEEPQRDVIEAARQRPDPAELLKRILNSEIVFYGQVLDRNDEPVAGATVKFSMLGVKEFAQAWEGGGDYQYVDTDQNGRFEIRGKGGTLYVSASHPDYYGITDQSNGSFTYGMPSGREPARDPDNPAILRLHKKGQAERLYFFDRVAPNIRSIGVRNGGQIYYDFKTGKPSAGWNPSSIVVSLKHNKPKYVPGPQYRENYDWSFRLTVPGGGLHLRKGRFDFVAPEGGYQEEVSFNGFAKDPDWKPLVDLTEEFFVRFADATYGRIEVRAAPGGFYYESYYNPTGSRNLEYDPAKRIKVQFR